MHKPPGRLIDPEEPVPPAGFVLDIEIIPRLVMPAPPLPGDALGSDGMAESMHLAAAPKKNRMPIAVF